MRRLGLTGIAERLEENKERSDYVFPNPAPILKLTRLYAHSSYIAYNGYAWRTHLELKIGAGCKIF